jgi:hypothetical protein
MIRTLLAASALTFAASSALAADAGDNVVLVQPLQVVVPGKLPGDCRIEAQVREVWAGAAFHVGQAISIAAPCSDGRPRLETRPDLRQSADQPRPIPIDPVVLRRRPPAAAHLDDSGKLIWRLTRKAYGNWGRIAGYKTAPAAMNLRRRPAA